MPCPAPPRNGEDSPEPHLDPHPLVAKSFSIEAASARTCFTPSHAGRAVRGLRDAGLSVADTAVVLGASKGRVSQLVA